MLSFPNICIISPLKIYFDYISKPFVTIKNIIISNRYPNLNNTTWVLVNQGKNFETRGTQFTQRYTEGSKRLVGFYDSLWNE